MEDEEEVVLDEVALEEEEERPARTLSPVQRAIRHFQEKGLSREDAAAFVFNLTRESGPNLQTNMVHDAGTGYGIAGFRDPTPAGGRRTNLFRFTGTRSPSLEQQLDFMWHELNSSENKALRNVLAARTPEEKVAAAIGYFRPAAQYVAERTRNASQVRALLGEGGGDLPAPRGPSTSIATLGLQEPTQTAGEVELEEVTPRAPTRITVNAQPQAQPQNFLEELIASQAPATPAAPEPSFMQSLGVNPQMALQVPDLEGTTAPNEGLAHELEQLRYASQPIQGMPTAAMSPAELAAGRTRQAAQPQGGRGEGMLTQSLIEGGVIPQDPLTTGLMAGATALPVGRAAKIGAMATGMALNADTGQAAPRRSLQTPEEAKAKAEERKLIQQTRMRNESVPAINKVLGEFQQAAQPAEPSYLAAGLIGGATALGLSIPLIKRFMPAGKVQKFRPVAGIPGTLDASNVHDLARTQDDVYRGVMSMMARSGAPEAAVKEIEKTFGFQTRAAATGLINQAMRSGKVETVAFRYESKIALDDLAKLDSPPVREYLYYRSMQEASERADKGIFTQAKAIGHLGEQVGGKYADEWADAAWQLERANPQLRQVADGVKELNRAMTQFAGKGEYATLGKDKVKEQLASHKYAIPYAKDKPPLEQNPFTAIRDAHSRFMTLRMENEPRVMLIDEMRKIDQGLAQRIPGKLSDYLKDNPHHAANVVTIYRRGMPEHYTTSGFVADILNTDVYHGSTEAAYLAKRAFERATTGDLNPLFVPTAMTRAYVQSKFTTPSDRKAPSMFGSFISGPVQQLGPQLSKYLEHTLRDSWFGKQFPSSATKPIADTLGRWYANSQFAEMKSMGHAQSGLYSYTPEQATGKLRKLIEGSNEHSTLYQGYLNVLESMNNASAWSYYRRNMSRVPDKKQLVQESRSLTGDPRTRGQYYTDAGKPIRYQGNGTVYERLMEPAVRGYGITMNKLHEVAPWTNIIQQSMKSVAGAYARNPVLFTGQAWKYGVTPAAVGYLAAYNLGNDPNGRAYHDYMLNGRSNRQLAGYMYFPIPGAPAEQGLEIPYPQELGVIGGMATIAMAHFLRDLDRHTIGQTFNNLARSPYFTEEQDVNRLGRGWRELAATIPTPPMLGAIAGQFGKTGMANELSQVFGTGWNVPREDRFDDTEGLTKSAEQTLRALAPVLVDFAGNAARVYSSTDEVEEKDVTFLKSLENAASGTGRLIKQRTPMIGPWLSEKPLPGNSAVKEEFFKRKREIDDLIQFSRKGDAVSDPIGVSSSGKDIAERVLGLPLPRSLVGISPREPTNPLYAKFIDLIDQRFAHDAAYAQRAGKMTPEERKAKQGKGGEEKGGIGFKAILDQHRVASAQVASMVKVNEGNDTVWLHQMDQTQKDFLKSQGVNHTNRNAVLSFYRQKQSDAERIILFAIRATENLMSKELGQPVTLKDLDPYAKMAAPPQ